MSNLAHETHGHDVDTHQAFDTSDTLQDAEPMQSFGGSELERPNVEQWLSHHSPAQDGADTHSPTHDAYEDSSVHADTAPAPTTGKGNDPAVDALLDKKPTTSRGPDGYAAWLLEAKKLGFVATTKIMANAQLEDLKAGRAVRTYEYHKPVSDEDEQRRKRETGGKLDNARRVPGKKWEWDIDVNETPILETLVSVARARIENWRSTGGKKQVIMKVGDFVRADMWFTPAGHPEKAPPHEPGTAIDLHFVGAENGEAYVLQLLGDLPAEGTVSVFRDTDDTLHLDRRASGYGLGIPAKGDFIPADYGIDPETHRCPGQKKAEQAAGDDHSRPIEAKGVEMFRGEVVRSTATWSNGAWKWTTWASTKEPLLSVVRSARVRDAIAKFGTKAPAKP